MSGLIGLDNSTLYTLQYIAVSPIEKLYTFIVKEEVLHRLKEIVTKYMEYYVGKDFKSLEILKEIAKMSGRMYNN